MAVPIWLIGTVALVSAAVASSVVSPAGLNRLRQSRTPGTAALRAFGSRSPAQRQSAAAGKLDAVLADLSRHAARARPAHLLADLHSMSPAARFRQPSGSEPLVLIDAVTRGDAQQLQTALQALGLQRSSVYANDVSGWLPVSRLEAAAARAEVHSLRAAMPRARTGAVTTQGDFAQRSDVVRSANSLTGAGVTVGVLSDSYDCYSVYAANGVAASGADGYASNGFLATAATDVASGDLPTTVNVLEEAECLNYPASNELPYGDEGRAMLQIVHDVAPGAALAFHTAEQGEADFANGIGALATAGAKVIADDVGYFDEPFYQDGILAQAVDAVAAKGVAYFSAAGNDGSLAYENIAPKFTTLSNGPPNAGEYLLNFDASSVTTTTALPVTIAALAPGEFAAIVVEWDQPYVTGASGSPGASSRLDVCITGATGSDTITDLDFDSITCTGANKSGVDPVQILIVGNPANAAGNTAAETLNIVVGLADGTAAPGRIKVAVEDDGAGSTIDAFPANSAGATIQGHPGAAGGAAVGAAFYFDTPRCGTSPAVLESYSSEGGSPILFDTTGTRLASPVIRQKPDFVAPDGVNNTFLGMVLSASSAQLSTSITECENDSAYPSFFGTSAAAPHVAGIAALFLQANAAITPSQIYTALRGSAAAMGDGTPNFDSGFGYVQADSALALLPPAAPTVSLGVDSVTAGQSTTITWSSINTASCTASGSWSGTLATSGTQTLTPMTAGTQSYSLACSNAAGTSATATATLTVIAAKSGGGGGLDAMTLIWLWLLAALTCRERAACGERAASRVRRLR